MRSANIKRETRETGVEISVNLDGHGIVHTKTGFEFIDHLITTFAKYSMVDIRIQTKSHDSISHHLIEDIGITLGLSMDKALAQRASISRFGYATIPMDESLSIASIDLIRRKYCRLTLKLRRKEIEGIDVEDIEHFFRSWMDNLDACIHIGVQYGRNDHHKIESAVKSFAVAFRNAASKDSKRRGIPSTKGAM
ncbi:MAG TPA: imidazoleglycerol-phosphate dehydratase [Nitrososphaeraceae archaeon]|jgi:imidazoleglycerol-phosphate dehydratase